MSTMASVNPSGKRRGSIVMQPRKRAKPTPVLRSRLTYTSFSNFVNQIIIPAVKENEYTYAPLTKSDEFRLLVISPSVNLDDPVYCQLVSTADHPANQAPLTYEALSYTWGNDDPIHEIKILNFRKEGRKPTLKKLWAKFYVRSNLHAALRYLRDSAQPVILWVDALCINQKDDAERNIQVNRMGEIYNQASNVCVWLGVGDPPSKAALDSIPKMLDGSTFDEYIEDESKSGMWQSLALLMRNPWFSRRWVVQELALAKQATLHCGRIELAWEDFAVAVALFMKDFERIHTLVRKSGHVRTDFDPLENVQALGANTLIEALSNLFRKSQDREIIERLSSLETLVSTLLTFDATDPRDIIYAVLSIAKDAATHSVASNRTIPWTPDEPSPPVADYKKSLIEVCKDFVAYCVYTSDSLDIICRHWAPIPRKRHLSVIEKIRAENAPAKEQLPSWISPVSRSPFGGPEDVLNGRANGDILVGSPNQRNYNAARGTTPLVEFGKVEVFQISPASGSNTPAGSNLPSPIIRTFPKPSTLASRPSVSRQSSHNESATELHHAQVQSRSDQPTVNSTYVQVPESRSGAPGTFIANQPRNLFLDLDKLKENHIAFENRKWISDGTMYVKGFRLGIVANLSSRVAEGIIPRDCFEMGGWKRPDPDVLEVPKVPDELWRTLVADRDPHGNNPPPWYPRACQICMAHTTVNGDLDLRKLIEAGKPGIMVQFLKRVECVIWNRKFIQSELKTFEDVAGKTTQKRLFGLAPESAKTRDLICIFLGCSVPVILREHKVSSDHYFELIGEAYISGMMDGEALGGKKMDELRNLCERFKLR